MATLKCSAAAAGPYFLARIQAFNSTFDGKEPTHDGKPDQSDGKRKTQLGDQDFACDGQQPYYLPTFNLAHIEPFDLAA